MVSKRKDINEVADLLQGIDWSSICYQFKKLQAIKEWALASMELGFSEGDVVQMAKTPNMEQRSGWKPNEEMMHPGARAVVQSIDYNCNWHYWYAQIVFEREWSTHRRDDGSVVRYWVGPVEETPPDYVPPSKYDQENHPKGRKHTFCMPLKYLAPLKQEVSA